VARPRGALVGLALAGVACLALPGRGSAADPAESNDLREFRVGMPVGDLPAEGYAGLACADDPARTLSRWDEYRSCPADARGLHEVRFRYAEGANPGAGINDQFEGTKVAGHPVLLTLLIGDEGTVDGLTIETDPRARLYLRKKAFLFADQVKARYGEEGWTCAEGQPSAEEQPVGGVFVKEHCEKVTPTRRITVERDLFRHPGQELKDFVGDSKITILLP
jgi:hypothetical protein